MTLILFVCRGNTCRSPMAEALARDAARRAGLDGVITFASAGAAPSPVGSPADPRASACMAHRGLDLSAHRSRLADAALVSGADRVFALDRIVRDDLVRTAPQARINLLLDLIPQLGLADVADPWHGTAADYDAACSLIETAVAALIADLQRDDA